MLKTAQVGLGWWGTQVTSHLRDSEEIQIVYGVDPVPAMAEKYTATCGLPVIADFDKALADPGIDAVILTTPHSMHEAQVLAAVAAGKQIFCEKPLSLSSESVGRMLAACEKAGIVLGVGHERRFEPAWEEAKRLIDDGELGTVLHVEGDFSWDRSLNTKVDNWRASKAESPAAGMTGMGVHLTDMLLSMVGPIVEVHAQMEQRVLEIPSGDVVSAHLRFADGTTGHIASVSVTPFYSRLAAFGSHGWAEARDTQHNNVGGPTDFFTRMRGDEQQSLRSFDLTDTVRDNYEEWARAVQGKGSYRFTDEERFLNVAVLEAITKSAEIGKPVAVPQYKK
jgi:predicted dehydrogenase